MTPVEKYASFLENLTLEELCNLGNYVSKDVHFVDPFNDIDGVSSMREVFVDMFSKLGSIQFKIERIFEKEREAILVWHFSSQLFGSPWEVPGVSFLRLDESGKVIEHLDYWDSGRLFLSKIPVLGTIITWLYNRIDRKKPRTVTIDI